MKRPAISTRLLRVLAIGFALSMLALYVTVKTLSAGKEKQRTRASSTKAQNIASVYRAAKAAAAEGGTEGEKAMKTAVEATHFSGTKSGMVVSPEDFDWKLEAPLKEASRPADWGPPQNLQSFDSSPARP